MNQERPKMVRVNGSRKCPICERPDWCLLSPDGKAAICTRVESKKRCGEAGWLHRLDNGNELPAFVPPPVRPKTDAPRWHAVAMECSQQITNEQVLELSAKLGLPCVGIACIGLVGSWNNEDGTKSIVFPERDGQDNVIGLNRRFEDGRKLHLPGGSRGLTLPLNWDDDRPDPLYIVEGPTDTAAMVCAGLSAWGRPSNRGGVAFIVEALAKINPARTVIIVGENDKKPDGQWPGLIGCMSVAGGVQAKVKNPVNWALAPVDYKDVREYLTSEMYENVSWSDRGQELQVTLAVTSKPAAYCPEGYTAAMDKIRKEVSYDEERWKY